MTVDTESTAKMLNAFVEFKERQQRKRISPQAAFVAGARYAEGLYSDLADEYTRLVRHMDAGGDFFAFQVEEGRRRNVNQVEPTAV